MNQRDSVIVVGAGMAGLAAARILAEAGKQVTVLEARSRIGGRIYTRQVDAEVLELGAEFVHGRPPELWRLIEEAGLKVSEVSGKRLCYDGRDLTECDEQWDDSFQLIEDLKAWQGADCSFAEYLEHVNVRGSLRERLVGYVEGFNAADQYRIGVASLGQQQAAEDAIEGERLFRICDGYAQAPSFLDRKLKLAGGSVVLDACVERVVWRPGYVDVSYRVQDRMEQAAADCVVITLPLGVLQAGSVQFSPQPVEVLRAAAQAAMGQAMRINLLFREKFWVTLRDRRSKATLDGLSFLHSPGEIPPVWWTRFPAEGNCLVGWVGGPQVNRLDGFDEDELVKIACGALARLFGLRKEEILELLLECDSHDWQQDPFSLGAYSYLPAGALEAPRRMSEPVGETLYFAGEHTDVTGHWGTVHAALRSGIRAAEQVLGN